MNPSNNPLFSNDPNTQPPGQAGFGMQPGQNNYQGYGQDQPDNLAQSATQAADIIRQKLEQIYAEEPSAQQEIAEIAHIPKRSKHQQYMNDLSVSGKSLAEIQAAWHNYYLALPDHEKHEVWQEFYSNNGQTQIVAPTVAAAQPMQPAAPEPKPEDNVVVSAQPVVTPATSRPRRLPDAKPTISRGKREIKESILTHVAASSKLSRKQHIHSLLFGVISGLIAVSVFLFSFFNEVIIAPFIQPSRTASATPIIVNPDDAEVSKTPQIVIPKINVQIPVDYTQTTINDGAIEAALDNGIVHYPTTEKPGETGNAAFFGHSSNNIFNKGKYKFAFVLLHELVPGDTFYISYNGQNYVYKVVTKTVVDPSQVEVLNDVAGYTATATLITCDPPGTTLKRLVVVGEQISPDPGGNTASSATPASSAYSKDKLPGNGPTLWTRMWRSIF